MNDLKRATYIAVLVASVMAIGWLGIELSKPFTSECEIAKRIGKNQYMLTKPQENDAQLTNNDSQPF